MALEQSTLIKKKALNFKELVAYTGYAESYLYKLSMQGKIPGASKPGNGKLFYDREKIEQWLLGSPIMTEEEKENKAATYCATH